jgi:DNA repair protein RadD|nr:MAG TPA: Type I site specific restriction modification protein [Caudoviricetes sp.]
MELRWYQQEAIDAIRSYTGRAGIINLPTGAGKSIVIAHAVADTLGHGGRALVAIHNGDLVRQNGAAIERLLGQPVGIVSASVGQKNWARQAVTCSIGSAFRHAGAAGRFDRVIIDECHLVSADPKTMYGQLLAAIRKTNPDIQLIGLSATPWRMDGPLIGAGVFDDEIYSAGTTKAFARLLNDGYLSPLVAGPVSVINMEGVRLATNGDYSEGDASHRVEPLLPELVPQMLKDSEGRKKGIVFAPTVRCAEMIVELLRGLGESCAIVTGETPRDERKTVIDAFRNQNAFRWMVSVSALTTGFDVPDIDVLACFRPTKSSALWVQILGRGTRVHPDKVDCLVLDYTDNAGRCGPIDDPRIPGRKIKGAGEAIKKYCPVCERACHASAWVCSVCGHEFPVQTKSEHVLANAEPPMTVHAARTMTGATPCLLPTTRQARIVIDKNGRQWCRVSWTDKISLLVTDKWAAKLGIPWGQAEAMTNHVMANGTKTVVAMIDTSSQYAKLSIPREAPLVRDVWWPVTTTSQLRGIMRRLVLGVDMDQVIMTRACTAAGVGCQYGHLLPMLASIIRGKIDGDVTIETFDQWVSSLENR